MARSLVVALAAELWNWTNGRLRRWALFQKYERGEERFYEIIEDKVLVEEVVKRKLW
jgi:hypothetical protein